MIVTGIEVIRGNPSPGLAVEIAPPGKLELTYGESLRITTGFNYRGPATDITLYGSIGNRRGFPTYDFNEILSNEAEFRTPDSQADFVPVEASVDIPITADIDPGTDYDIYCKLKEYPGAGMPQVDDVITIAGMPPTFELLEETIYPYAYVYDGDVEVATFTFKSDPFTPVSWIAGKLAASVEAEVEKAGGRVLEMRVYVDKSPLLWTDWRIEVVGISPEITGVGSVGIVWWAVAILAALAIILIIVITWSIKTIISSFTRKPLSEEVKQAWSRETLIKVIGDFETKLERTPTPPEELEAMSDQELRDYCNELASAVAPPAAGLGLGLAIAAAGVLGLGALAVGAYAMSRGQTE